MKGLLLPSNGRGGQTTTDKQKDLSIYRLSRPKCQLTEKIMVDMLRLRLRRPFHSFLPSAGVVDLGIVTPAIYKAQ